MRVIKTLLVVLLIFAGLLYIGGTDFQKWSKRVDLKDPLKTFEPVINKLPKINFEKNPATTNTKIGNVEFPRLELPKLSKEEIVEKEYVTKHELKDITLYQKLFDISNNKQVFLYQRDEKPTVTYVKLNKKSIERNYGNQQSFPKKENPVGWTKNKEVDIHHNRLGNYHGHFWNRSHLVADQLGGDSIKQNAITGTRTQNVGGRNNKGGMRVPEERAYNYIKETGKELLYFVDVIYYEKDNIIPNEVRVTLFNDEIREQYVTYNIANGYEINYKTGTFERR